MPTTVIQLSKVRSQLAETLLDYLDRLSKEVVFVPSFYPNHLKKEESFDKIQQTVQVVEYRKESEESYRSPFHSEQASRDFDEADRDDLKHFKRPAPSPPFVWDENASKRNEYKHVVFLGDPGFGKSSLLQYEARRLARDGVEQIHKQTVDINEIVLPVFLSLSEIGSKTLKEKIMERLLMFLGSNPGGEAFCRFITEKLEKGGCVVFLDAWDEVNENEKKGLKIKLADFVRGFPDARIRLTSRIVEYIDSLIPKAKELTLMPLDISRITAFVEAWFGKDTPPAKEFIKILGQSGQERGLGCIPLMLALMCRSYKAADFRPQRAYLYERCLCGLLGDWKQAKDNIRISGATISANISLLQKVSYAFFVEGKEKFDERLLLNRITDHKMGLGLNNGMAVLFITRLIEDGIFIPASADTGPDRLFRFFHQTFHEYLTARELATRGDYLKEAMTHLYDPMWQEVLRLVGGVLEKDKVETYITALLEENKNDLIYRPFQLAVFAATETDPTFLPSDISEHLMKKTIRLWISPPASLSQERCLSLITAWGVRALPSLLHLIEDNDQEVRKSGAKALGWMGLDAVPHICPLLEDQDKKVRKTTVEALRRIGLETSVFPPDLLDLLKNKDYYMRKLAVENLGWMGLDAFPHIRPLLQDENPLVRSVTVQAIIRMELVKDVLPELLTFLRQEQASSVRSWAAEAMRQIKLEDTFPLLRPLLRHEDIYVRHAAALAMRRIKIEDTFPQLRHQLPGWFFNEKERVEELRLRRADWYYEPTMEEYEKEEEQELEEEEEIKAIREALRAIITEDIIEQTLPSDGYVIVYNDAVRILKQNGLGDRQLSLQNDENISQLTPLGVVQAMEKVLELEAIPNLLPLLKDESPWVQEIVAKILRRIGEREKVAIS